VHMAEMGVLEMVGILEPKSEHSVHPDVSEPHDADGQEDGLVLPPPKADHHCRQGRGMSEVVDVRSCPRAADIPNHEEIWHEQHHGNQPPRSMSNRECNEGTNQQRGAFHLEPYPGGAHNRAVAYPR
jgi:hypothetical protein